MKLQERPFLPVILGGDIGTYSLARSFHEEYGIRSVAISTVQSHLCYDSSIINNIIEPQIGSPETFVATLLRIADDLPDTRLILLACGDWYVRLIVENRDRLEGRFVIPYIKEDLLNELVLKDRFYELCERLSIPYPKTEVYDCTTDPKGFLIPFDPPIIAKPASSAEYHYVEFPGKKKVFRLQSRAEAEDLLEKLYQSDYQYKFLIQDFIPGDDTNMRILTTYSDRHGKVRFMAFGQTLLEDPGDMGIGNPIAIINRVNETVMEHAKTLLETVGYTGFANFDIKYDKRDGSYRFFEINTRLGRSNFYVTGSGFNTVKWIVDDLIYEKDFADDVVVADTTYLYTLLPQSVLLEEVRDGNLRQEIKQLYKEKHVVDPIDYHAEQKFLRKIYPSIARSKLKKKVERAKTA